MHPCQAYWHSAPFDPIFSLTLPHLRKFSIGASIFIIGDGHYPRFLAFFCAHPLLEEIYFPGVYSNLILSFPSKAFSNVRTIAVARNFLIKLPYRVLDQLQELELLPQHTDYIQDLSNALNMVKGVRRLKLSIMLTEQWLSGDFVQRILKALPGLEELEVFSPFQYYAGVTVFSIVGSCRSFHMLAFPSLMICGTDSLVLTFTG